jgi:hypothetical protein
MIVVFCQNFHGCVGLNFMSPVSLHVILLITGPRYYIIQNELRHLGQLNHYTITVYSKCTQVYHSLLATVTCDSKNRY